jgi:hypothetical protein
MSVGVKQSQTIVIPVSNRRVDSSNTSSPTPKNPSTGSDNTQQLAEGIELKNRDQINDFLSQSNGNFWARRKFAKLTLEQKIQFFILQNRLANINSDPEIRTLRGYQLFRQKHTHASKDSNSTFPDPDKAVEKKRQALIDAFKQTLDEKQQTPNIDIENFSPSRNLQSLFAQFLIDDSNRQVKISKTTLELYLKHKSFSSLLTSAEELKEMRDSLKDDLIQQGFPSDVLDTIIKESGDKESGDQEFVALVVQSFSSRLIDFEGIFRYSMNPVDEEDQNKILDELERYKNKGNAETESSVLSDGDESSSSIKVSPGNPGAGDTKPAAKAQTKAEPSSNDPGATIITSSSTPNTDPSLIAFLRDYFAERNQGNTELDLEDYMQNADEELNIEDRDVIFGLNKRFKNYSSILSFARDQTTSTGNIVFPRISREEMAGIYKSVKSHQRRVGAREQQISDNVVKYSRLTNSIIKGLFNSQPINIFDLYAEAHEKPFQSNISSYILDVNLSSLQEDAVHYLRTYKNASEEDPILDKDIIEAIFNHQLKQANLNPEQQEQAISILETLMNPLATIEQLNDIQKELEKIQEELRQIQEELQKQLRKNKNGKKILGAVSGTLLTLLALANIKLDVQQDINIEQVNQIQNSNNVNDIVYKSRAKTIESLRKIYSENESSNFTALDSSKEQPLNTIKYFLDFVDFFTKKVPEYAQYFSPKNFNKKDLVVFFPVNHTLNENTYTGPIKGKESKYYRDIEENYKPIFDGLPPELQEYFGGSQGLYNAFFEAREKAMSQYKFALGRNIRPSNYIFPLDITLEDGEIRTIYFVDATPPNNGKFDLNASDPGVMGGVTDFLAHSLSFHFQNETNIPINQDANRNFLHNVFLELSNSEPPN